MQTQITNTLTGATGIVAVEVAPYATDAVNLGSGDVLQAVVQIVIGLVTLFQLVRKKKAH